MQQNNALASATHVSKQGLSGACASSWRPTSRVPSFRAYSWTYVAWTLQNSKVASDEDCMSAAAVGNVRQCKCTQRRYSSVAICCGQAKYSLDASSLAVTMLHTERCTEVHHCMQKHVAVSKRSTLTAYLNNTMFTGSIICGLRACETCGLTVHKEVISGMDMLLTFRADVHSAWPQMVRVRVCP